MIAIKDMEMPKNCLICKFSNFKHKHSITCLVNNNNILWYYNRARRDNNCPLVEVKDDSERKTSR